MVFWWRQRCTVALPFWMFWIPFFWVVTDTFTKGRSGFSLWPALAPREVHLNLQKWPPLFSWDFRITSSTILELLVFSNTSVLVVFFLFWGGEGVLHWHMKFLEATEILTKDSPLVWVPWNPWWNFCLENSFRWFVTPWVACTLAIGAWWFWARHWTPQKKNNHGEIGVVEMWCLCFKRLVFPTHCSLPTFFFFCPGGHVSWELQVWEVLQNGPENTRVMPSWAPYCAASLQILLRLWLQIFRGMLADITSSGNESYSQQYAGLWTAC